MKTEPVILEQADTEQFQLPSAKSVSPPIIPETVSKKRFYSSLFDTIGVAVMVAMPPLSVIQEGNPRMGRSGHNFSLTGKFSGGKARLFSRGDGELRIEASHPKFLSGQNLVGIEDLSKCCPQLIFSVLKRARIPYTEKERQWILAGNYRLTRVDFAAHCDCVSPEIVPAVMRALMLRSTVIGTRFSTYTDETMYFSQHSSRRTLVVYNKGEEMAAHPLKDDVVGAKTLQKRAASLIRIELRMREQELKARKLDNVAAWSPEVARDELTRWIDKLVPLNGVVPNINGLNTLPSALRNKLKLFLKGDIGVFDETPTMKSQNRADVLRATGIDIANPYPADLQKQAFKTIQDVFVEGVGFKGRPNAFARLRAGKN